MLKKIVIKINTLKNKKKRKEKNKRKLNMYLSHKSALVASLTRVPYDEEKEKKKSKNILCKEFPVSKMAERRGGPATCHLRHSFSGF